MTLRQRLVTLDQIVNARFWWFAAAVAALHLTLAVGASWNKSVTMDEAGHIAAGLSIWSTGDTRIAPGDPPLVRLLTTLPLLILRPQLPHSEGWRHGDVVRFQNEFANANQARYHSLVRLSRFAAATLGALTVLLVAAEARSLAGSTAALGAALLLACEPSFTANSGLATVDVGAALFATLWLILVRRFLEARPQTPDSAADRDDAPPACLPVPVALDISRDMPTGSDFESIRTSGSIPQPSRRRGVPVGSLDTAPSSRWLLVAAGVTGGLAVAAKFTVAALALPIIVLVALAAGRRRSLRFFVSVLAAWLLLGLLAINLCYLCDTLGSRQSGGSRPLATPPLTWLEQAPLRLLPLPIPNRFLEGLDADFQMRYSEFGQHVQTEISSLSYLWSLLNKATLPALLLLALAAIHLPKLRNRPAWTYLATSVLFVAVISATHYMHGIRFLLPAAPMLVIAGAVLLSKVLAQDRRWAIALAALLLANLGSTLAAMPNLISYQNLLSPTLQQLGSPLKGSDVDWGQDLPALRTFMQQHQITTMPLLYFGGIDPEVYGIGWHYPGPMVDAEWVAVSIAYLRGQVIHIGPGGQLMGVPDSVLRPYRNRRPDGILGGSIALFRGRRTVSPARIGASASAPVGQTLPTLLDPWQTWRSDDVGCYKGHRFVLAATDRLDRDFL